LKTALIPPDYLKLRSPAPDWFRWAVGCEKQSRWVTVDGCPIHYLYWPAASEAAVRRGLLFVHGGGAHAEWWSFIAPYFMRQFNVAALDFSGMGDSGRRSEYPPETRAREMRAVIADAGLGEKPFVVGHSYGGFMLMKFAAKFGSELGGAVIVDSPIRSPEEEAAHPTEPPRWGNKHIYPSFDAAMARFRLMPPQPCDNEFIVEYIGRHSIMPSDGGWTWKFDGRSIGARRFGDPFREYLLAVSCRSALIFGERSSIISRETASYMSMLMGPRAPIVEVPEAHHHVMLDQPLAFVATLRMLLENWIGDEIGDDVS
jgi:pimeloyl-ACP methyl ester carboxylesterase